MIEARCVMVGPRHTDRGLSFPARFAAIPRIGDRVEARCTDSSGDTTELRVVAVVHGFNGVVLELD